MKHFYLYLSLICLSTLLICCSNDDTKIEEEQPINEFITNGKNFALIHNECLSYMFEKLKNQKKTKAITFGSTDFTNAIVTLANAFIDEKSSTTRADEKITNEQYEQSLEEIRSNIPQTDMKYINMVSNENVDIDTLLQEVSTDPQLQAINKQAVICYITTYVASSEYWQEHYTDWAEILDLTLTRTRFNWKNAAVADALYGYQGLLFSGFNLMMGGASAAVGSVLSGLE